MFTKLIAPDRESEITKFWKYTDKVYISVVCTSYNQEVYIRDAIESFLAQECEYKFEIIIHDDASTDHTGKIVKEYADKYPNIIKPILQTKNQYSIYPNKPFINCCNAVNGEYIALCEGDDFWVDKIKLQHQTVLMEKNPNYNICCTNALMLARNGRAVKFSISKSSEVSIGEVIKKTSQFAPTATYFFKRKVVNELPIWLNKAPIGDFYIEMYSMYSGEFYYCERITSVYRLNSVGSWTESAKISIDKRLDYVKTILKCNQLMRKDFPCSGKQINNRNKIILLRFLHDFSNDAKAYEICLNSLHSELNKYSDRFCDYLLNNRYLLYYYFSTLKFSEKIAFRILRFM